MLNFLCLIGGSTSQDLEILYHPIREMATNAPWREHQLSSINIHTMIQTSSIMVAGGGSAEVDDSVVYRTAMLNRLICSHEG